MSDEPVVLRRLVELRYRGQRRGIQVRVASQLVGEALIGAARDAFEQEHERLFGFGRAGRPIEIVGLQVTMVGATADTGAAAAASPPAAPMPARRRIHVDGADLDAIVYPRASLPSSFVAEGPCVIEELTATTYAPPGWRVAVDADGMLELTR
jgi:N-methylhydantoinase A